MRRIRRSLLFVPGGMTRYVDKGLASEADGIILDLEDAVAMDRKAEARSWVHDVLQQTDFGGKERVVRINTLESGLGHEDIAAVVPARPDSLILPKVNSREDVLRADAQISAAERSAGIEPGSVALFAFIELPQGVENAVSVATSCGRLAGLLFGAVDFATATHAHITRSRRELYYAMSRILCAARVAGIDALDSVCVDVRDPQRNEREARQAVLLGYDGKLAIHPDQLAAINLAFTPAESEVHRWVQVVDSLREAQQSGRGVATVGGSLVEKPHLVMAARILGVADVAGMLSEGDRERLRWAQDALASCEGPDGAATAWS